MALVGPRAVWRAFVFAHPPPSFIARKPRILTVNGAHLRATHCLSPRFYATKPKEEDEGLKQGLIRSREPRHEAPGTLQSIEALADDFRGLVSQPTPPDDETVVKRLKTCKEIALKLRNIPTSEAKSTDSEARSSARKLLDLEETRDPAESSRLKAIKSLSELLHSLAEDPKVFISPRFLELYVEIQAILKRPETFPEVFKLYATKPIPIQGSSPVRYKNIRPSRLASAIPQATASQALDAAIESRILPLCLDVIETSVCAPAHRRQKIIQKMWVPAAVMVLTPPAAWLLALSFDQWQITLTSRYARTLAFTGFVSYVGFTGILGYVALTTANDQMERVTWRDGIPLTTRWLREDERAMMDRIALAWGFKSKHRYGDEDGPEWDALKELVSMRDMILDRVELMEGME